MATVADDCLNFKAQYQYKLMQVKTSTDTAAHLHIFKFPKEIS